jgi:hypothetical protein
MTVKLSLTVNDASIETDNFVGGFIDHTTCGMIEALKSTGEVKDLDLVIEGVNVTINLNGVDVPLTAFANRIIQSTIIGMVSTLKGVNNITKLSLVLHK